MALYAVVTGDYSDEPENSLAINGIPSSSSISSSNGGTPAGLATAGVTAGPAAAGAVGVVMEGVVAGVHEVGPVAGMGVGTVGAVGTVAPGPVFPLRRLVRKLFGEEYFFGIVAAFESPYYTVRAYEYK